MVNTKYNILSIKLRKVNNKYNIPYHIMKDKD